MHEHHHAQSVSAGWKPFRIVILAELEPRDEYALKCPRLDWSAPVTLEGFDNLISGVGPAFRLHLTGGKSPNGSAVDIRWKDWGDIEGGGLVACPAVAALLDAQSSLARGSSTLDPMPFVKRALSDMQSGPALVAEPIHHMGAGAPSDNVIQLDSGTDRLGALFDLVDLPTTSTAARKEVPYDSAVKRVATTVSDMLVDILAHPEYQRLRRVWHSLRAIALRVAGNRFVELTVISTRSDAHDLEDFLARIPSDLVILEEPVQPCARDANRLNRLADWAEARHTPVVVSLAPDWVSASIASDSTVFQVSKSARTWLSAITRRAQARWLVLTLNDLCDCEPATGEVTRGGPTCSQPRDAQSNWAFLPAAIALGTIVANALVRDGEPFFSIDAASHLRSQAIYEFETPQGVIGIGTRAWCSSEQAKELSKVGLAVFVPTKNRDFVRIGTVPCAHRPVDPAGDLGDPVSTLADQLLASRVVRSISEFIPSFRSSLDHSELLTQLEARLYSLFPKPPPVGPEVEVTERHGTLVVAIRPRRYGGMTETQFDLTVRLD